MVGKNVLAVLKAGIAPLGVALAGAGVSLLMPSGGSASGPYSALDQLLVPPAKAFPCNGYVCSDGVLCFYTGGNYRCIQEAGYCFETVCNGGS